MAMCSRCSVATAADVGGAGWREILSGRSLNGVSVVIVASCLAAAWSLVGRVDAMFRRGAVSVLISNIETDYFSADHGSDVLCDLVGG
jgi:hypothetical protein